MKKNLIFIIVIAILLIVIGILGYNLLKEEPKEKLTDAIKFQEEYPNVTENNPFVYTDVETVIDTIENGTGIVYLGFPECKWCQSYVEYLEQTADEYGIEKILYYNVSKIREDNTNEYQKIVSLLEEYLDTDSEGNPRVFVPDVTFVRDGEIVGHDNETSTISGGEPEDYWTEKKIEELKERLGTIILDSGLNTCTECN